MENNKENAVNEEENTVKDEVSKFYENEEDYSNAFFETIKELSEIATKLQMFDTFASRCIIDIIELMLSKNNDYLQMLRDAETKYNKSDLDIRHFILKDKCEGNCQCGNNQQNIQTPLEVQEEVDDIIANVKKLLEEDSSSNNTSNDEIPLEVKEEVDEVINSIKESLKQN